MCILGLNKNEVNLSVSLLSDILKEEFMLFGNILNVHWNIEGQSFIAIHNLLEKHYEFVKTCCDDIAERIRVFGVKAPAQQTQNVRDASITEIDEHIDLSHFIYCLSSDYEKVICGIRNALIELESSNDFGAKSLLEDQLRCFEKIYWELISNRQ